MLKSASNLIYKWRQYRYLNDKTFIHVQHAERDKQNKKLSYRRETALHPV